MEDLKCCARCETENLRVRQSYVVRVPRADQKLSDGVYRIHCAACNNMGMPNTSLEGAVKHWNEEQDEYND